MGDCLLARSFSSLVYVDVGWAFFSLSVVDTVWYLPSLLLFLELYLGCLKVKKSRMLAAFGWIFVGLGWPNFFFKSSRTIIPVASLF